MNDTKTQQTDRKNDAAETGKPEGASVEFVDTDALVVYDEHEVKQQKRGLFGGLKRKATPSREQLGKLLLENIEAFPEKEAQLLRRCLLFDNADDARSHGAAVGDSRLDFGFHLRGSPRPLSRIQLSLYPYL